MAEPTRRPSGRIRTRLRSARALLGLGHDEEDRRLPRNDLPRGIAIIMDGNARWAREHHLPIAAGHREGAKALKTVVRAASDVGIEHLTVFSFSTENWSRPETEVTDLMSLFSELIDRETGELNQENVRMTFVGRIAALPPELRERIATSEAATAENTGRNLHVAMNYGASSEIVEAARRFADLHGGDGTDEDFSRIIADSGPPDPELLIRTSGEQRLSNFLLWQCAYSELYFTPRLWPDFGPDDLEAALDHYAHCQRRFGAR